MCHHNELQEVDWFAQFPSNRHEPQIESCQIICSTKQTHRCKKFDFSVIVFSVMLQ